MAAERHLHAHQQSVKAASAIPPFVPVTYVGSNALLCRPAIAVGDAIDGFSGAATTLAGEQCTVYEQGNHVKAIAAASVGAGALVGIASTNGGLGPFTVASGSNTAGKTLSAAAAGEKLTVSVNPRQF